MPEDVRTIIYGPMHITVSLLTNYNDQNTKTRINLNCGCQSSIDSKWTIKFLCLLVIQILRDTNHIIHSQKLFLTSQIKWDTNLLYINFTTTCQLSTSLHFKHNKSLCRFWLNVGKSLSAVIQEYFKTGAGIQNL